MAIRYAVASGNWSSTATWNGGTLPASTDDVYANNFTVNIDQTITVNSLKKISNASPVIAAGGKFVVTAAATVTITAGILAADHATGAAALLEITAGTASVTVNSSVVSGAASGREGVRITGQTGTVTFNGNLTSGDTGLTGTAYVLHVASACVLNLTGTVSVPSTTGSPALYVAAGATVTVTGNVTAGQQNAHGVAIPAAGASANVTVTGIVTGGTQQGAYGVHVNATGARATIIGEIRGGAGTTAYGLYIQLGGARVDALLKWGSLGAAPIHGVSTAPQFMRTGANLGMESASDDNFPAATGAAITIQRYTTGNPAPADVRSGTTYGPGGTSTGTLAVPPAASVAAGVPVDNTVGTAAVKLSDVASVTGAQIAAATSG